MILGNVLALLSWMSLLQGCYFLNINCTTLNNSCTNREVALNMCMHRLTTMKSCTALETVNCPATGKPALEKLKMGSRNMSACDTELQHTW